MNDRNDRFPNGIKIEPEQASIKVMLTKEEALHRARLAHESRQKALRLEEEKKRANADYKARIEAAQAIADRYAQHASDEFYTEIAECPARLVPDSQSRDGWVVEVQHPTSGEVLHRRTPSPSELAMAREPKLPLSPPQAELDLDGEADDDDDEPDLDREHADDAVAAVADFEDADRRLVSAIEADVRKGDCTRARALERLVNAYGAGPTGYRAIVERASEQTLISHLELITGKHQQPQAVDRLRARLIAEAGLDEGPAVRPAVDAPGPPVDLPTLLAAVEAKTMGRDEAVDALLELHGGVAGYLAVVDATQTADELRTHLRLVADKPSLSDDKRRLRTLIRNTINERTKAEG